jgi:GT2 family glycosyltransferase
LLVVGYSTNNKYYHHNNNPILKPKTDNSQPSMTFSAFIITYKRKNELIHLLQKIREQTVIPQHILIIDNDPDQSAKNVHSLFTDLSIEYYPVGYNAGPAGAANYGLDYLSKKGYDFIAWLDDDDPPYFNDAFEQLLGIINLNKQCGCVGLVGQHFNHLLGVIKRVHNDELKDKGLLSVSYIAGNMIKIVNAEAVRSSNIFPEKKIFFGFEELEFDLKLQKAGYTLLVDKENFYRHRKLYNRINIRQPLFTKKTQKQLIRDYYSTRNLLFIMNQNRFFMAFVCVIFRVFFKSLAGFIYGPIYGSRNLKYQYKGILHFLTGRYGQVY